MEKAITLTVVIKNFHNSHMYYELLKKKKKKARQNKKLSASSFVQESDS